MVLVLGFSLFALAGYGVTLAQVDHDPLKFYFEDNPLRVGIETLDEHVAGAGSMSVLVERDGGVKDLALLQKMEALERLRSIKISLRQAFSHWRRESSQCHQRNQSSA